MTPEKYSIRGWNVPVCLSLTSIQLITSINTINIDSQQDSGRGGSSGGRGWPAPDAPLHTSLCSLHPTVWASITQQYKSWQVDASEEQLLHILRHYANNITALLEATSGRYTVMANLTSPIH
ncbi:unnamed protein product [Danaus chrysippus]|uniref:(African queen) hypothetical protein n=1 Tax=Danaus chrysippus TaxID=151541 RepID=A0A8J2QK25_9NEOP|nr:unnamed protein product [Danaus chrysippus]